MISISKKMLGNYNPFSIKKEYEETEYGTINYYHEMGSSYVTHRKKEHFFKKYQGFGISESEIRIAKMKRLYWIMILYHKDNKTNIPYRIELNKTKYFEKYNNEGDMQIIIPIKEMEFKTNKGWEKTR